MTQTGILRQNMSALIRRAAVDEEFRRLCLENGAAAYLAISGSPLQARHVVRFIEAGQEVSDDGEARCVRLPKYIPKTWLG